MSVVSTCVCEGCVAGVAAWFADLLHYNSNLLATATAPPNNPPMLLLFKKAFDDFFLCIVLAHLLTSHSMRAGNSFFI